MKNIINLALLLYLTCSCTQQRNEMKLNIVDINSYLINGEDTVNLGNNTFKKDLFQGLKAELFPTIQNDGSNPPDRIDIYDEIEGIYINSKIFDSFRAEKGEITKIDNNFDILFIYSEMSRYNFQFSETLSYRIFHYSGYLYAELSNRQNLPYFVNKITQKDNNSLLMTYTDKSNFMGNMNNIDTLVFSTYPAIKFEFSNKDLSGIQKSSLYIKLSDDILNEINISTPPNTIPQDINELYLREIITKLLNKKFNSSLNTNEILEKNEQK